MREQWQYAQASTFSGGANVDKPGADELNRASDPGTSSSELGKLAFSEDPAVVAAVLDNPSTPSWVLGRFGAQQTPSDAVNQAVPVRRGAQSPSAVGNLDSRLLAAQLAAVDYIRAGLTLVLLVISTSAAVTLGNQAEFRKSLICGQRIETCDESGGMLFYILGTVISILLLISYFVISSKAASHRQRAGA